MRAHPEPLSVTANRTEASPGPALQPEEMQGHAIPVQVSIHLVPMALLEMRRNVLREALLYLEMTLPCKNRNVEYVPILLLLGDWHVLIYACAPDTEVPVRRFGDYFRLFLAQAGGSSERLRHLVITSSPGLSEQTPPMWLAERDRPTWEEFYGKLSTAYRQFCQVRSLDLSWVMKSTDLFTFSWPGPGYECVDIYTLSLEREERSLFFSLVIEDIDAYSYLRIFGYSLFLATQWHVMHGGLCLHSAAVARERDGFLFLGDSEAGKTTVARFSALIGRPALGDDLNFIIRDGENYLMAAAPSPILSPVGYSMLRPSLRGVFTLVQDDSDYLIPLSPKQVALILFDAFIRETPYARRLSDEMIGLGFQTCCDIARRVPGYELHFRKSPEFWKVIDEQFPD